MRTEAGRESQHILQVVLPAPGERDAGQFRVRLFIIGDRGYYARVQSAYSHRFLQRCAHGVPGEAFDIADDNVLCIGAKSFLKGFHFGRSAAAPGGRISFMRHEESFFGEIALVQAVNFLYLFDESGHDVRHMVSVQPAYVVSAVGGLGQQQAGERLHAPVPDQRFILYHQGHRARADYKAVPSFIERQRGFGHILFGRGGAGSQEPRHGPFLYDIVGYIVGGNDDDPFRFACP